MYRCVFFIVLSFCFIASTALAKDFKSPHKLEAGQTLSADVLNEIIESLSYSEKIPTRDDFLGNWDCKVALQYQEPPNDFPTLAPSYNWTIEQNLIHVYTGSIIFSSDGNGNYYVTDPHPEVLLMDTEYENVTIENEPYAALHNFLYWSSDVNGIGTTTKAEVEFRGDNQFIANNTLSNRVVVCNKTNTPPEIPDETSTSIFGNNITLTWTDRSEDETGFTILRRDKLEGQWAEIANIDPATGTGTTVTYTNTGLSSGTFWYRVQAINTHGKSLGSNVSKVEIP
ncbi:MAG: hypothetical protein U9R57_02435 [Thermodesulfobacteriota bacterium]|nr:hypothetical protein [Thermodesulfobacteriota bacterium]